MKHMFRFVMLLGLLMSPSLIASAQTPVADSGEPKAYAHGLNQPATFFDDRGNPIFEVMVTGMESDWQDYDEYSAPERGMVYVKVDFTFTNLTDRAEIISPYTITLVDTMGLAVDQAYISDNPEIMIEDTPIDPGATVEGSLVFAVYQDLEPMMVVWQPDYALFVFIYLGE